ncbi:hypothetical protein LBMAG48_06180 [Phycisphaerae bacterium]|nr:hypothetical protein LBMAG48_06180 [Phycisphaerae bacterium]
MNAKNNKATSKHTPGTCSRGVLPFDDCSGVGCPAGGCGDACAREACNAGSCKGAEKGESASGPADTAGDGAAAGMGAGVLDRRSGIDRRDFETGDLSGLERRRGPGRRLSDFSRSAEEGNLTKEQFLFVMAIEAFKKANGRVFPTWTDVLEVMRLLGYRKTMPMEMNLSSAEDWQEPYNAPSNVRPPRWAEHKQRPGKRDAA